MSSDAQIYVLDEFVCYSYVHGLLYVGPTLRLKNHANHVPGTPRASHVSMRGRRHDLTLDQCNAKINMPNADSQSKFLSLRE